MSAVLRLTPRRPIELIALVTDERGRERFLALTVAMNRRMLRKLAPLPEGTPAGLSAALRELADWVSAQ